MTNQDMKHKVHDRAFRMYGDSCYLIYVKRKTDSKAPLSQYEYYWHMRIPELSNDDCIALMFTGASLSDYILDIELCMGRDAYVSSSRYFCEITCCNYKSE